MESIKFKEIELRFLNLFNLPSEEKLVNCKHQCTVYSYAHLILGCLVVNCHIGKWQRS